MGLLTGRGGLGYLTGGREAWGGLLSMWGGVCLPGKCLGGVGLHDDPELLPPTLLCMTIPAMTPKTPIAIYLPVLSSCLTITGGFSVLEGEYSGDDVVSA